MIRRLRPMLIMLGVGAVLVVAWTILSAEVAAPVEVRATSTSWDARFVDIGATTDYLVTFSVTGIDDPEAIVTTAVDAVHCDPASDGLDCDGRVVLADEPVDASIRIEASDGTNGGGGAELEVNAVDVARQTRRAPFSGNWLGRLFLLALLFVPVIVATHEREALSQWLLIAFSASALAVLQLGFTLALAAVLIGFYALGRWYRASDKRTSRFVLTWLTSTVLLLVLLKNFKAVFFLPFEDYRGLSLVLPLGTSYFLIRLLDLQLRWHRGQLADLTLRKYLVYVLFPGTLVAGPIELVDSFFANRAERITRVDLTEGLMRIAVGVAKKLIVVDALLAGLLFESGLWEQVLTDPGGDPWAAVQFCVFSYLFAYLDFSSYSDIAIGLSRMFGYTIGENFRWPIGASNLSEFWRRWHISLSGWAFRNVFFPVMASTRSQTSALLVTLLVVGMWHDLALTWVTWGLYHGIGMAVLAWWRWDVIPAGRLRSIGGIVATNAFVAGGFAFVGIRDYGLAWRVFAEFVTAPVQILLG